MAGSGHGGAKLVKGAVFDSGLLNFIVCPLSKQPLRYCEKSHELICASIGVAYPIVDGIPMLAPVHGRILHDGHEGGHDDASPTPLPRE